ncbi:cytochrome P450 [Rhodocollybia butyracea]|uniref:Cytochrome P450 n=1 Tax=Rhodocollybia butyracea TaxID=206335 RepID=A0A9P5U3E9_9AGAR|nr:cytochrome P450 [Rhodocollybia butyracea]
MKQLSRVQGGMVHFHGLGHSMIILNDLEDIHELFHHRGQNYSNRPYFPFACGMLGLDQSTALMSLGKTMSLHRRLAHTVLTQESIKKYQPVQEDVAALMVDGLLKNPDNFAKITSLATTRIITTITYGFSVKEDGDEYMKLVNATMDIVNSSAQFGAHLVDAIPSLRYAPSWLPFSLNERAKKGKALVDKLVNLPFEAVKKEVESGAAHTSLTSECLLQQRDESESTEQFEHAIKWTAATLYAGNPMKFTFLNTHVVLMTCIMLMALHPEKQKMAQEELDRVVGPDELPTISDSTSLPILGAIIKETLRWHPALPLGIAHVSAQDDVYKGMLFPHLLCYQIPAGTILVPNICALASGEDDIHDSTAFYPERFLDSTSKTPDPGAYVFGFGRRVCPGKHLAESSLFILIATMLCCFDIRLPLDRSGHEIPIDPKFYFGFVSHPQAFKCIFAVRSNSKAIAIAKRAAQSTI